MRVHNQLSRGTVSSALKSAVGDTKPDGGVERYGETLVPVIDLWSKPEWALLREERLIWSLGSKALVAGEFAFGGLRNPANSGLIVVVERVLIENVAGIILALELRLRKAGTALTGVTEADTQSRDFRDPSIPRTRTITGSSVAAQAVMAGRVTLASGVSLVIPFEVILAPDTEIFVQAATAAQSVSTTWFARERIGLTTERV